MSISPTGPSFALGSLGTFINGVTPVPAALNDGRIVVTWAQSLLFPTDGFTDVDGAIFMRTYSADGTPEGPAQQVNTTEGGLTTDPDIAVLDNGDFVISWVSNAAFGLGHNDTDIHVQRYGADGTAKGGEIIATIDDPFEPGAANSDDDNQNQSILALQDGGFAVMFSDRGPVIGTFVQEFSATGAFEGGPTLLVEDPVFLAGVAQTTNGNIVAAWDNLNPVELRISGSGYTDAPTGISGASAVVNRRIDPGSNNDQPLVAALASGGFAVVYNHFPTGGDSELIVRTFDATGTELRAETIPRPDGFTSFRNDFTILGLEEGGFVVAWVETDSGSGGIRAQAFNGDGTKSGDEAQINSTQTGLQSLHDMTETAPGRIFVSYTDQSAPGSTDLLQGRFFDVTAEAGDIPVAPTILEGTDAADSLLGTDGQDTIQAKRGADTVTAGDGDDVIFGQKGFDLLFGERGNDSVSGGAGNDQIFGNKGADQLFGDDGDDQVNGGLGPDLALGGTGNDALSGGDGNDTLKGGQGVDSLNGGNDADLLEGGRGPDVLAGDGGNDTIFGGLGPDLAFGGTEADVILGDDGNDSLRGGQGPDSLMGGNDADDLQGGRGPDTLVGGQGVDTLNGGDGPDLLFGNRGPDRLEASSGNDTLTGGLGPDSFVFAEGATGTMIITDFEAGFDVLSFAEPEQMISAPVNGGTLFTHETDAFSVLVIGLEDLA